MKKTSRKIKHIAVHCTATKEGKEFTVDQIRQMHLRRGFSDIGYHFVIYLNGTVHIGRDIDRVGAHVKGYNTNSIGITYVGGLDSNGKPKDTRTPNQKKALLHLLKVLKKDYPTAEILGHRDFSPDTNNNGKVDKHEWLKDCPCYDAKTEYQHL